MKYLLCLAILAACASTPTQPVPDLKFGVSTESDARVTFNRCQVFKVVRPDGSFELQVYIRALGSLHVLEFNADGVLIGTGGSVTK